jgi:hypothetical protein
MNRISALPRDVTSFIEDHDGRCAIFWETTGGWALRITVGSVTRSIPLPNGILTTEIVYELYGKVCEQLILGDEQLASPEDVFEQMPIT